MASVAGVKAGRAFVTIEAVDKTARVLNRFARRFSNFAARIDAAGREMVKLSAISLAPFALSTRVFVGFDDAMKKVEARSQGTAAELAALRQQAEELGGTTSFTASQVANLQAKLAQKGFDRSQIRNTTKAVLDLARAAGEGGEQDTIVAADILGAATAQFSELGRSAEDTARIADVFTAAVNNSNLSLETLQEGMRKVAPIASQFNLSFEDTVALVGSLGNVAIEGSEAGTSLRNMFLNSGKNAKTFNQQLREANGQTIQFTDAAGNLRNLPDILREIGQATQDLGTSQRGQLLETLFGKRAITGAAALSGAEMVEQFSQLSKTLKEAQGTADATAKTMDSGLGGAFRRLWSAAERVANTIGESVAPALMQIGDLISDNLTGFAEWVKKNQEIVATVAAVAAGVGALGVSLLATGAAIKLMSLGLSALSAVLSVTRLAVLATAAVKAVYTGITLAASAATSLFTGSLAPLLVGLGLVGAGAVAAVMFFDDIAAVLTDKLGPALGFAGQQIDQLAATFSKAWGGITKAIQAGRIDLAFEAAWAGVKLAFVQGVGSVLTLWDGFMSNLGDSWDRFRSALAIGVTQFWSGLQLAFNSGIETLITTVLGGLSAAIDKFASALGVSDYSVLGSRLRKFQEGIDSIAARAPTEIAARDREIVDQRDAAVKALESDLDERQKKRAQDLAKRFSERAQKEAQLSNELEAVLAEIDEAARKAEQATDEAPDDAPSRPGRGGGGGAIGLPEPARDMRQALTGLEKGSVEAAKAFIEAQPLDAQLKAQQETNQKLDDLVRLMEDVAPLLLTKVT